MDSFLVDLANQQKAIGGLNGAIYRWLGTLSVRSKVSRTKADMRSITVGIESYFVDNNHYPTMRPPRPTQGDTASNETLGNELSTPIAYLSSMAITNDPFKSDRSNLPPGREKYNYRNYLFLVNELGPAWATAAGPRIQADGAYRLVSAGPDRYTFWDGTGTPQDYNNFQVIPYDPTNGTISIGDIFRTQAQGDGAIPDPLP